VVGVVVVAVVGLATAVAAAPSRSRDGTAMTTGTGTVPVPVDSTAMLVVIPRFIQVVYASETNKQASKRRLDQKRERESSLSGEQSRCKLPYLGNSFVSLISSFFLSLLGF
jgi:hypothetical protein